MIAIIGILAVAFLPTLLGSPAKARDTQRIATVEKIANILRYHYSVGTSGLTLPPGWYCISPNPPLADLNLFINNNLADFGGIFPKGPLSTWDAYYGSAVSTWCRGGYGYALPGAGYRFAIFSRTERINNANSCAALTITSTTGCTTPYFTVLVQQ